MKLALATVFCGTAAAFAPSASKGGLSTTTLQMSSSPDLDSAFGVSVETGNKCPPLGAAILRDAQPAALKWFQNAEIKHGRVAMIATIGFINQKLGVHFPLYLGPTGSNCFHPESSTEWYLSKSADVTFSAIAKASPVEAVQMVPLAGWLQILFAAGLFEATAFQRQWNVDNPIPGDYGYDPLGFTKREGGFESEELKSLRLKEIKNGRVAMMTIAGWYASETIPGSFPVWHP